MSNNQNKGEKCKCKNPIIEQKDSETGENYYRKFCVECGKPFTPQSVEKEEDCYICHNDSKIKLVCSRGIHSIPQSNTLGTTMEILQTETHVDDIGIVFIKHSDGIYCAVDFQGGEMKFKLNFIESLISQSKAECKDCKTCNSGKTMYERGIADGKAETIKECKEKMASIYIEKEKNQSGRIVSSSEYKFSPYSKGFNQALKTLSSLLPKDTEHICTESCGKCKIRMPHSPCKICDGEEVCR